MSGLHQVCRIAHRATVCSATVMVAALAACGGGGGADESVANGPPAAAAPAGPSGPSGGTADAPVVMPSDFDSDEAMSARQALAKAIQATPAVAAMNRCSTGDYPSQVEWPGTVTSRPVVAASEGGPMIRQVRDGQVIATYTSLGVADCEQPESNHVAPVSSCGAFPRGFGRNWQEGDVFEIHPGVYEGADQQIWIGPTHTTRAERASGQAAIPRNLTLRGITVDGRRPVIRAPSSGASANTEGQGLIHVAESQGITIENIDVIGGDGGRVGQGAIYLNGAKDLTLRHLGVRNFDTVEANGIFATDANAGVLRIDGVELSDNGGNSGPQHNIYINPSSSDRQFTVWMTGSYLHDAKYGNTFKSRAQVNLIEGNYFQGSVSADGGQTEAYLLDLPEGGRALVRNNVLVKNASGVGSNGALMSYAVEGVDDDRQMSFVVEHNTFLAYAKTIGGTHVIFPIFTPYQHDSGSDSGSTWPFDKVSVNSNLFAGFCGTEAREGYRGDSAWTVDFTDLDQNFSPLDKTREGNAAVIGKTSYVHVARRGTRRSAVVGAVD